MPRSRMTGLTVTLRDTRDYYYQDLRRIIITTILVVLGILIVLLRALVAPLYLIVSVVLSYLSRIGMWPFSLFQVHPRPGIALERARPDVHHSRWPWVRTTTCC